MGMPVSSMLRTWPSLHLIYHPVDAEYKGQMSLEGSYWEAGGGELPFSILGLLPNLECSRKVCEPKAVLNLRHKLINICFTYLHCFCSYLNLVSICQYGSHTNCDLLNHFYIYFYVILLFLYYLLLFLFKYAHSNKPFFWH